MSWTTQIIVCFLLVLHGLPLLAESTTTVIHTDENTVTIPTSTDDNTVTIPTSTDNNTVTIPTSTDDNTMTIPTSKDDNTVTIQTSTDDNTVTIPTSTDDNTVTIPTSTDDNTVTIPTSTDDNTVTIPTSTDDNTVTIPTSTDDKTVTIPTSTDDNTATIPTSTDENTATIPTSTDDKTVTIPTSTDDNTVTIPTSTDDKTVTIPISTDDKTVTIPTSTDDNTVTIPTSTDDNTVTISTSIGENTVTIPTSTDENNVTTTPTTEYNDMTTPITTNETTVTTPTTSQTSSSTNEISPSTTRTSSSITETSSSTKGTTLSIGLPITTNPLVSSVNISNLLMYIAANISVSGTGLTYNDSNMQELVRDFVSEMSRLLEKTTGFREIRVTGVNDTQWPRATNRGKRSMVEIIFYSDLVLSGGSNLSLVNEDLHATKTSLTLLNTKASLDLRSLQDAIPNDQLNIEVCSVYRSVEKCKLESYECQLVKDVVTCTHRCHNYNMCGDNGQCYFDDLQKKTLCRCEEGNSGRYYTGMECSVEAYKLALPPAAVIGISAGLGGALLLVILVLVVRIIRNRKKASRKEESSYKLSGVARDGGSQWELKHYNDPWSHRQLATDAISFDERPYLATQDNFGNPIYMYRPDDRAEQPYTMLKPGSSLSSLNLPESKFEISRPKIILGH